MKPEQERLVTVLKDTISLLCKNSLSYENQVVIQGLICVTVDKDDVVVVQVNDSLGEATYDPCVACGHAKEKPPSKTDAASSDRRKRPRSPDYEDSPQLHSPSKSSRYNQSQSQAYDSGNEPENDDALDDNSGMELLPIKKEEIQDDDGDDEDLVLIGEELGKNTPTLTGANSNRTYVDNDSMSSSSFQQQQGDGSYITGFMQNTPGTQIMPRAGSSGQQQQSGSAESPGNWDLGNVSQGGVAGNEPSMVGTYFSSSLHIDITRTCSGSTVLSTVESGKPCYVEENDTEHTSCWNRIAIHFSCCSCLLL